MRTLSSAAVALDIDGVLIRGGLVLPPTRLALQKLFGRNSRGVRFPVVFLTNGGGAPEAVKAKQLSAMFDLEISPQQVILSHSPFKFLARENEKLRENPVLVVGPESVKDAAKNDGFKHPITTQEVFRWYPTIWPFLKAKDSDAGYSRLNVGSDINFAGVLVYHDSLDWGRDIQIICDVLRSDNGKLGTLSSFHHTDNFEQALPLYFSNPDFVWANEFPLPRFAQGAFRICLENLYLQLTGHPLHISGQLGKPFPVTYQYASAVIEQLAGRFPHQSIKKNTKRRVYAVGDNIAADIIGANNQEWCSILVRSGVYKENSPNITHFDKKLVSLAQTQQPNWNERLTDPTVLCDDIGEAVDFILREEGCV